MNILCAYRYGIVGGVSTQLLLRQGALERVGVDCDLFFAEDNGLKELVGEREGVHFGTDISLRQLLRGLRPAAAIVVDSPELLAPLHPWLGPRPQLYLDVHTTTEHGLSYLHDLATNRLSRILVPTHYSAGLVRGRLPSTDPQVVPNLIDTSLAVERPVAGQVKGAKPEFIWVGKLDGHKNWRMALVWGRLLREMLGDIHLNVVGGYTASDERVDEFLCLADELDLTGTLRWIDRIDNASLPSLYRRASASGGAMLVTSRDESFGMAVAEALLCNCPVIANDLPVFREVFPESPMIKRVDVWRPETFLTAVEELGKGWSMVDARAVQEHLACHYGTEAFLGAMRSVLELAQNE